MSDNKFDALMKDSNFTFAILYNEANQDFELVSLSDPAQLPQEQAVCFHARGLAFAGLVGLVNGAPRVALDLPIVDTSRISQAFVQLAEDEFNRRVPKSESTSWLQRLWSLPDTRAN